MNYFRGKVSLSLYVNIMFCKYFPSFYFELTTMIVRLKYYTLFQVKEI